MDAADELIVSISEFVKNRLYFITFNDMPDLTQGGPGVHYFCTDELFRYENFYDDFGPLNLSMLYRYCHALNLKLRQVKSTRIIHSTSSDPQKRVNAAYLIGCYAILYLNFTPQEAYETLTANSKERLIDFRDASSAEPHTISLMDCLAGLFKAKQMNFFDFANFDFEHYEFYERVENGDLNWLVPRKFLAFCGPYNACENIGNYPVHGVAFYHRYFRSNGVSTVVRLNKRAYNASLFTRAGFAHRDLYFLDGSTPTDEILYEFLQICEGTTGAIAVHCKAGLGRTGTLIGCYIMKHYRFTAREAIAWIRICRPGSIIGPQQEWLQSKMSEMWHDGQVYRRRRWRAPQGVPALPIHRTPIYTIRVGHPFAGIASKYHRQHIRLHCRIVGQSRFADTSNKDESKAATTAPAQDTIKARRMLKQKRNQTAALARSNAYKVIQRKVNTMNLDDTSEKVVQDQLDTDDDCGDSEYSDTDVDIASNNNNPTNKMKDVETTEESEVEQEVEINANIQSKSNINNNNNITKVSNRGAKLGNITQGDKLNQIKAQRTRYPRLDPKSIESTSAVTAAKIVRACQPPVPSASSGSRTDARVSNAKRRGCTGTYSASATASARVLGSNELSVRSIRRTSPRLAAQAAAAAVARSAAKGKGSSSSCSASSGEDIATTNSPIRPNANIWVSRVVPNNPAENATASNVATLSGMEVERETRAKRALISERRIVKVFRKSNQGPNGAAAITGAPIKTRKVEDSAVNQ